MFGKGIKGSWIAFLEGEEKASFLVMNGPLYPEAGSLDFHAAMKKED